MKYYATIGQNEYEVEIKDNLVWLDGEEIGADLNQSGVTELYSFIFNGQSHEVLVSSDRANYTVTSRGEQINVHVEDERTRKLNMGRQVTATSQGDSNVTAPIPGLVVKILVSEGDEIQEGEPLAILEAMKMENEIRSVRSGVIGKIHVEAGARVEQDAALISLE
ncbi:MAG: DUF2118 domain-containing protein [Chloroflexota bacterium]